VKRESSKKSFERWRLRKVKDTLESMRAVVEDEKENDVGVTLFGNPNMYKLTRSHQNISPIDLISPVDPLLYGIKSFSQENEYTTSPPADEPVLDDKRNTFGNHTKVSPIFGSTRDSHSQEARLSALIAELPAPPRRRTWPDDEHKIARKPLPPGFRNSTATHLIKQEVKVEVTALSDPTLPGSPKIEVHIAPEHSIEISPQSSTPDIPPRSPLRAPCLEHLSFVSSISCTSRDTLPSTRQITPPILDQYLSHSQGTADMTPPLPSPTPQSPHAIPWFLREDFSVPAPELPSEHPSRRGSGFRTSAVLEVDVEAEVCGVCRLARGEDSCTCNWGDLMFSSESDSVSSGSIASRRSDVKIGCLKLFGNRVKGGVGNVRRRFVGVMKLKRGGKSEDKEWIVYRWRSAA
jgi:hypothetical protein